jgi:predicted transcriptional regulator
MAFRTQTMVQLTDELVELLDRRAASAGVSRSQLIRQAIEAYLNTDREAQLEQRIIEGYKRMPQGGEYDVDEWGNLGAMMSALTENTFRQMEEEERAAGLEPW